MRAINAPASCLGADEYGSYLRRPTIGGLHRRFRVRLRLAPDVGRAWESTFANAILPEQRGVVLRTSFVIGQDRGAGAGAMSRLGLVPRLGLGAKWEAEHKA